MYTEWWRCRRVQTVDNHAKWLAEFKAYLQDGKMLTTPPKVPGRPGLSKPMRMIWYAAPHVVSPAHSGTDYVSNHRVLNLDRMSREVRQMACPGWE